MTRGRTDTSPPPHDLDSERGLLGGLMRDPSLMDAAARRVAGRDFYDPEHGAMFDLLAAASEAGEPIGDMGVVVHLARTLPGWNNARIARLWEQGIPRNAGWCTRQIEKCSKLRRLQGVGFELLERVHRHDADPTQIQNWLDGRLHSLGVHAAGPRLMHDVGSAVLDDLDDAQGRRSVFTGVLAIDERMAVLMPGELTVLAARPGCGKTSLAMQIAASNAAKGRPVLFVSLEMTDRELVTRAICSDSRVNEADVRTGSVSEGDKARMRRAHERLRGVPSWVWSPPSASIADIRGVARLQAKTDGLDLLVVDYVGLVKDTHASRPRHEHISEVSRALKSLAKEIDAPVLACCQLNREADKQQPTLAMLRDSGSIEQDADAVLFLHSGGGQDVILNVAKNRHGPTGDVALRFIREETRFVDDPFNE